VIFYAKVLLGKISIQNYFRRLPNIISLMVTVERMKNILPIIPEDNL